MTEIWHNINCLEGEYSTNDTLYDANNLIIKLDSFKDNSTITLLFPNVLAYRLTFEHFRWEEYRNTEKTHENTIQYRKFQLHKMDSRLRYEAALWRQS